MVPVVLLAADAGASDAAGDRLTWVVLGLVVLATVIAIMTLWFWRATRPDPVGDPEVAMRWLQQPGGDGRPPGHSSGAALPQPAPGPASSRPMGQPSSPGNPSGRADGQPSGGADGQTAAFVATAGLGTGQHT